MNILFAAAENSWGGFLGLIRDRLPEHHFEASGSFEVKDLKGFDVLIPTMSLITDEILETGDRLRLIQQCGSGLEGVDLEAARKRDIRVANVPSDISGNADSVAELGIYMMIGLSRDPSGMAGSMKAGKMGEPQGRALTGRTVGLVGLGGIGKALINRLKPFGVRLMGIKRSHPGQAKKALGLEWAGGEKELPELLKASDFLILCLPHTPESHHIINRESLALMKTDAFLINLSRGGLVDREALENALVSGSIAGAGLDVFWEEPPDPDDPVFSHNVLATPHVGGSTDGSMDGIVGAVAENIRRLDENKEPFYIQN